MTPTIDHGTALLHAVLATAKEKMPGVILHLATAGQLEALVAIRADSVFDPAKWKGEYFGQYAMGDAILPLLHAVPPEARDRAVSFVTDWRAAFDAQDIRALRMRLRTMKDPALVRAVVSAAGQQLDDDHSVSCYVKSQLDDGKDVEPVKAAIESSNAIGNYRPLEAALEYVAKAAGGRYKVTVADVLIALPIPVTARVGLGKDAVQILLDNQESIVALSDSDAPHVIEAWLKLLQIADVTDEQWRSLGAAWTKTSIAPKVIAGTPALAADAAPVLSAILRSGTDIENLLTNSRLKVTMPMLHYAAKQDNTGMVQLLLAAGANPERIVGHRDPKCAVDFAPRDSVTQHVLFAWRARRAIGNIIARPPEMRPT
jgi:hypothetical protein